MTWPDNRQQASRIAAGPVAATAAGRVAGTAAGRAAGTAAATAAEKVAGTAAGIQPQDEERRILRSRIDLTGLPPLSRELTEHIICATADLGYATDLVCYEPWLEAAISAISAGAPVIADVPMVAVGLAGQSVICKAAEPLTARLARTASIGWPAAAVRLALGEAGPDAIWVVGSEPLAIYEILARDAEPALVIGLPAGFSAAVEAKEALRSSGVPSMTNVSAKGGSVAAVAGCLALLRLALALAPALPEHG